MNEEELLAEIHALRYRLENLERTIEDQDSKISDLELRVRFVEDKIEN